MDEGKRDPFEDFMCALYGHDTVVLVLTGVGETTYSTQEVHEMISSRLNSYRCRERAAVEEISTHRWAHVKSCANYETCYKEAYDNCHIMPCATSKCRCFVWRGPEEGEPHETV